MSLKYVYIYILLAFSNGQGSDFPLSWDTLNLSISRIQVKEDITLNYLEEAIFLRFGGDKKHRSPMLREMSLLKQYPHLQHAAFLYCLESKEVTDDLRLDICINIILYCDSQSILTFFQDEINYLAENHDKPKVFTQMIAMLKVISEWERAAAVCDVIGGDLIIQILVEHGNSLTATSLSALLLKCSDLLTKMNENQRAIFDDHLISISKIPGNPAAVYYILSKKSDEYPESLINDQRLDPSLRALLQRNQR